MCKLVSGLSTNKCKLFSGRVKHNLPMTVDEAFSESNPVPHDIKTLEELWDWHKNLIEAENEWKKSHPDAEL